MLEPGDRHLWTALRAARVAAGELDDRFQVTDEFEYKNGRELVTPADIAAEEHIVRILSEAFPDHNLMSEESLPDFVTRPRWIIDPLDGTTNYYNGVPHFSVSIAFEGRTHPDVGVVYYVPSDLVFVAIENGGAYINGRVATPSETAALSDAFVATGFDSILQNDVDTGYFERLVRSTQGVRRTGSAVAELAMVASGTFDIYIEHQLDVWDTAAGTLLIEEAGGEVTHIGAVDDVTGEIVVASNSLLHSDVINFMVSEGSLG